MAKMKQGLKKRLDAEGKRPDADVQVEDWPHFPGFDFLEEAFPEVSGLVGAEQWGTPGLHGGSRSQDRLQWQVLMEKPTSWAQDAFVLNIKPFKNA